MPSLGNYREFMPQRPARRGVETVWSSLATKTETHLVLPDGRMDIILRFHHGADGSCTDILPVIAGPTHHPGHVPITAGVGFVGLRLLPGRAGGFGPAAHTFAQQTQRGPDAITRIPALQSLPTTTASVQILTTALQSWIATQLIAKPPSALTTALDFLHITGGRIPITAVAETASLSPRQLHRLFLRCVGLPPKTFAEILQFHRALRLLTAGLPIAAVAHETGFADQPHMTRRFQRLGGFSPAARPPLTLAGFTMSG